MSRSLAPAQLWSAAAAAAADRYTIDELAMLSPVLMERAALCVSAVVEQLAGDDRSRRVVVLVGPGNNGGDGLAIARQLHGRGRSVCAVMAASRPGPSVVQQGAWAQSHGVEVLEELPASPGKGAVIVDALLGTGSRGAARGTVEAAIAWLEALPPEQRAKVVAVDLPSGIDVDTGAVLGRAVTADVTVTFGRSKPGLHLTPARAYAGEVVVAQIGLVEDPSERGTQLQLIDPRTLAQTMAGLSAPAHKGQRGHVGVIGGTGGTPGAAILAGSAALRIGAGLVTLAPLDPAIRGELVALRPELMLAEAADAWRIAKADVLVVGPGLVEADRGALEWLEREDPRPMVWDASALACMKQTAMPGPRVLTPHPGEAARMLASVAPRAGWTNAKVQADRRTAAEALALATGAVVVLKGGGSIVAESRAIEQGGSRLAICTAGGPALASAGTGDVLAGAIAGLLARGLSAWDAACVGVHVHALAGDRCLANGAVAMDVANASSLALAELSASPSRWPRHLSG